MNVIGDRAASRAEEIFLAFVGTEKYDASLRHGVKIAVTVEFNVAGSRGDVENVIIDSSVLTQASSRSVVDAVNAAGIEKEMILGYPFCANHFSRLPFL